MRFELCVPARNEEPIIGRTIRSLREALATLPQEIVWRVVVAENGSSDGTADVVKTLEDSRTALLRVKERGKGAAVVHAAQNSRADFFGFIDADISPDPAGIPGMLSILVRGEADIVVGSRLIDTRVVSRGGLRTLSSRAFNMLRRALHRSRVKDSQCGLKLMNARGREILVQCREKGWFFDMEFLERAEAAGLAVQEVPVVWEEGRYEGRKSGLKLVSDGLEGIRAMLRIRRRLREEHVY